MVNQFKELETNLGDGFSFDEFTRIIFRRKKLFIKISAIIFSLSCISLAFRRIYFPIFRGDFYLLITDPTTRNSNSNSSDLASGMMFEELALNRTKNDIPTLIEVLKSPLVLTPISKKYDLELENLRNNIIIEVGGGKTIREKANGVLEIYLTGTNKSKTLKILKDLSDAYLSTALKIRQQNLSDGLKFLNRQAPTLQQKTNIIQNKLESFRRKNKLLEPQLEGKALKVFLDKADQQIIILNSDRQKLLKVREEIINGSLSARGFKLSIMSGSGESPVNNPQNQGLSISDSDQSLLQQLETLELQLANSQTIFKPESKIIKSLKEKISQIKPQLRDKQLKAVDAALNLNQDQLKTVKSQREKLNAKFTLQPKLIKEYNILLQDLTLAKENLSGLIAARENFQLDMAQQSVPWRVISPPEMDQKPLKPHLPRNLVFGILLSLFTATLTAIIRDRFDHVFNDAGEVDQDLKSPILGHIPFVDSFKDIREENTSFLKIVSKDFLKGKDSEDKYDRFFYQEAMRNLFTSIKFLSSDSKIKVLTLTSSIPAEGKSLVNILLAKTISDLGKRVLLIDADLRKPQIHKRLELNNIRGLSNYLSDDSLVIEDVTQNVPNNKNWDVITAGQAVPDTTRLFSSKRMKDFIFKLKESKQFDFVIFDTTPLIGLADALLVSQYTDGVILLVSLNKVDRSLPLISLERIRSSKVLFLGVLTNSIKKREKANIYGYGGYGGYGRYGRYGAYQYTPYSYYNDEAKSLKKSETTEQEDKQTTKIINYLSNKFKIFIDWLNK